MARGLMTAKHQILRETFGYDAFRPGQEEIVDGLIAGRHVLAVMPTGSGKSLCFQVPEASPSWCRRSLH
jgi:ATP-dependent DNA helicase RecQ